MRASKNSFLDHVKWLRRAVMAAKADLLLAGDSMQALVRQGQQHWVLHPRFLTATPGGMAATPRLDDGAELFLGWLPYAATRSPLPADRASFVRLAGSLGLPTQDVSSETSSPDRLRAWFWEGRLVCAESPARPAADDRASSPAPDASRAPEPRWAAVMQRAGRAIVGALPKEVGAAFLFTVDAVVDGEGEPALVHVNADPIVHPLAYPAMVASLLSAGSGALADAPQAVKGGASNGEARASSTSQV